MTNYMADPVATQEFGKVIIKAWVYECDTWQFRELTEEEVTAHIRFVTTVDSG